MAEDLENGARLLIDEIEAELKKGKTISPAQRLTLRSVKYLLAGITPLRQDIATLKSHDVWAIAARNPRSAALASVGILLLNSMINWSGLRKPIIQAIVHAVTGAIIPLDQIP